MYDFISDTNYYGTLNSSWVALSNAPPSKTYSFGNPIPTLSGIANGVIGGILQSGINLIAPYRVPGAGEMWSCYYAGLVSKDMLQRGLRIHGADLPNSAKAAKDQLQDWWSAVGLSNMPVLAPHIAKQLLYRDWIDETEYNRHVFRNGMSFPVYLKDPGGPVKTTIADVIARFPSQLPLQSYIGAWRRELITTEELNKQIAIAGPFLEPDQKLIYSLANVLPSAGEIVSFATGDVYNDAVAERWQLDEEQTYWSSYWLKAHGTDWGAGYTSKEGVKLQSKSWTDMYWRLHWQRPGVAQAIDWWRRFSPEAIARHKEYPPDLPPFTDNHLLDVMRANGIPPGMRDWLLQGSYLILGIRQVQRLIRAGVVTEDEVSGLLQDQGYRKETADLEAKALFKLEHERRSTKVRKLTQGQILKAYEVGVIDERRASIELQQLSYIDPDDQDSYLLLPEEQQATIAWANPDVQYEIQAQRFQQQVKLVDQWVKITHRRYIQGAISQDQATQTLTTIGIKPLQIQQYMQLWTSEKFSERKAVTVGKLLRWVKVGIISLADYTFRLAQLGYTSPEIDWLVTEAEYEASRYQDSELRKAASEAKKAESEKRAEATRLRSERARIRSELQRHGTPGKMEAWVVEGLMDPDEYLQRLLALDWPHEDATRMVEEAIQKRDKQRSKGAKPTKGGGSQAPPPPPGG